MALEVQLNDRTAFVEFLGKEGDKYKISVDGKTYDADIVMVEEGVYSLLYNGKSFNIELAKGDSGKKFIVNTLYRSYDVEIIDAEAKYLKGRSKSDFGESRTISTPMPGKIIKIPVKVGDKVSAGDTVVIVSAMKMESEYKVKQDRVVKKIMVKEGDTVDGNQPLIVVE